MIKGIYSVQDLKSGFDNVFCCVNDHVAIRDFQSYLTTESIISQHPEDFRLCKLAELDTISGTVVSYKENIKVLYDASSFFREV
ncbi:nonstructural protein [Capybara microvirus Cap1_SP_164]|nr:nonstructural protein [Capybara microvirus Cap1_SP_164]